jgi:hypothetical protein
VTWQRIWTGVNPPVSADNHFAFYDPARDRIWVMSRVLSDTLKLWSLDLATDPYRWIERPTDYSLLAGTTIQGSSLGFDPTHDRVLAFGGFDTCPSCGATNAITAQTAAYDPIRDRMILTTGMGPNLEMWALTLGGTPTWTQLAPEGAVPQFRFGAALVSDPSGQRVLLIGGRAGATGYTTGIDTWAFDYDKSTSVEADLISADATPDQVTLRWYSGVTGSLSASVYRRVVHEDWRAVGRANPDGSGLLTWTDRAVVPGAAYDYRLGIPGPRARA